MGAYCFVKGVWDSTFSNSPDDQDKNLPPHVVCYNCEKMLCNGTKGKKGVFFGVPWVCKILEAT